MSVKHLTNMTQQKKYQAFEIRNIRSSCYGFSLLFLQQVEIMAEIVIPQQNWERIRIKVQRKYSNLKVEDLTYKQGEENELIMRLERLLSQNRDYVVFMLRKMQVNIENNRL